tara:strand:- start:151 stop:627 length:477 start_codon:yes stop_codon:yes gene_type:complete
MTKFLKKLKEIINPTQEVETQTTILEKKAGTYKVERSIDDEKVPCETLGQQYYSPEAQGTWFTGVPAPVVLSNDSWFGDVTYKSQKQLDYMEKETEMKRQEREENFSVEPDDIHQKMYEIATKNQNTTLQLNPPGGSENFHEGVGGWNSGNGMGQFVK